jgi:hypothetical protein
MAAKTGKKRMRALVRIVLDSQPVVMVDCRDPVEL